MCLFLSCWSTMCCGMQSSNCCELKRQIEKFTEYKNADNSYCDEATCLNLGIIQKFLHETNAMSVSGNIMQVVDNALQDFVITDQDTLRQIMVWSFIGKWFSDHNDLTMKDKQKFLQFDSVAKTFNLKRAACEYQQTFYITMITLSLFIILFLTFADQIIKKFNLTSKTDKTDTILHNNYAIYTPMTQMIDFKRSHLL